MIKVLLNIAKRNNYKVFTRPYELNIWGIRSKSTASGKFDDEIIVFFKDEKGNWQLKSYEASTDPGTFFLKNPMQNLGTAILNKGQHLDKWQGQYNTRLGFTAYELVQSLGEVEIIRDYNRDAFLDFNNGTITKGFYGLNIHVGTSPGGESIDVGQWSAGCQVFANWNDYQEFTKLCERHAQLYGNKFSYTLIDKRQENRARLRYTLYISLLLALIAFIYVYRKQVIGFYKSFLGGAKNG
ncbi:MAG: hypothetical protein MUC49_02310 [Raineya sp.]|jgi:hypothetical protein|nr:hypothetical protein [Raineya sp.]